MSRGRSVGVRVLFGRRLRALRRLRGLTQAELAKRANVSGRLVGQIERGGGNPTLEVIMGFAAALSIEAAALLQFEEDRSVGKCDRAAGAVAAREEIARYLARKTSREVEKALRLLEIAVRDDEKP